MKTPNQHQVNRAMVILLTTASIAVLTSCPTKRYLQKLETSTTATVEQKGVKLTIATPEALIASLSRQVTINTPGDARSLTFPRCVGGGVGEAHAGKFTELRSLSPNDAVRRDMPLYKD